MLRTQLAPALVAVAMFVCPFTLRASAQLDSRWTNVKHLVGFGDAENDATGDLAMTKAGLSFTASGMETSLRWEQIGQAEGSTERAETGGTPGKLVRFALPYGGGSLLGTFTQKNVGILTLRFTDLKGGIHYAVFILPRAEGLEAQKEIVMRLAPIAPVPRVSGCPNDPSGGLRLRLGASSVDALEYQGLLYEHLVDDISRMSPALEVFRGSSDRPLCKSSELSLTIESVAKGTAVVRTVSGPAGLFLDVTHIRVHVVLTSAEKVTMIDQEFTASRRGDRESLTAASTVAGRIEKSLRKSRETHSLHR